MFRKLKDLILRHFIQMNWGGILVMLLSYAASCWLLLLLAGETALISNSDFIYWLIVTGSTVGYGDLSPTTTAGKYLVALYIIPVGLSIFALVVGKIASWVGFQWRKGVKGLKHLEVKNHILIIGWNGQRTIQLIKLLLREQSALVETATIVLCVRADIENPMPDHIEFVKVDSFNSDDEMQRCGISNAGVVIIDNPDDELTMTSSLYASSRNPEAHILAYFNDESLIKLLGQHCPNVECMPSVAVEMLAKSAFDPGSSVLHHDLLNVDDEGQAQFSINVPDTIDGLTVDALFTTMKTLYSATLIGIAEQGNRHKLRLNPALDTPINKGDKVYYIAQSRITNLDWKAFNV